MNKQQAFDLFSQQRAEFLEYTRWLAVRIARDNGGYVNIDLVRELAGEPDFDNRAFGAVFNTPYFEPTGYTQTTRKASHGRTIRCFKLIENNLPEKYRRKVDQKTGNLLLF